MSEKEFAELVGIAVGEASMAWSQTPMGVFDSDKCANLVRGIVNAHEAILAGDESNIMEEL